MIPVTRPTSENYMIGSAKSLLYLAESLVLIYYASPRTIAWHMTLTMY